MNLIFRYMKPHFPRMVVGFMVKFSGTVMDLLLPWILAYIIDEVVPEADIARVVQWGLVMVVCAFIAVLGNVTANRMASSVARDSMRVLRNDTFTAIMNLSCGQVDNFSQSTLISRMTSDTYNIHQIMNSMQRMGVRAPILLIGGIIVTMTLDPVLSAILASTLPFLAIVVIYVAKKGIPLYNTHQKASDVMIGRVRESITGIRVIKALSKGDYERERFENINLDVVEKEKKAGITMALTNPVMNFLLNVGWVMIIFVGAVRVNAGRTTWDKLGNVNEHVLANYLKNEYPQTIAVILSKIKAEHAAKVIALLPENFAMEIVMRMIRMDSVQKEVLDGLEKTLRKEFMSNLSKSTRRDSHELIADIFNSLDRNTESRFMEALEERNRESAERVKSLMFTFEDLIRVDAQGIQILLRNIDKDKLAVALKGASETIKDLFFNNMSSRAGKILKEDMEAMGPVRLRDVEEAQQYIVTAAKELSNNGEIVISEGKDSDELIY